LPEVAGGGGFAEEIAFLGRAIIVLPPPGAASAVGDSSVLEMALGIAVPVTAEGAAKVEAVEAGEEIAGVERAAKNAVAEREMGADEGGFCAVQRGKRGVEPGEGGRLDVREEDMAALRGIEADELPAGVLEVIIDGAGEDHVERGVVRVGGVVVIADCGVKGNAEAAEDILYGRELFQVAIFAKVAVDKTEVGLMAAHRGDDGAEPRVATFVAAMDVVDDDEPERGGLGGGGGAGAEAKGEESGAGGAEHLAAGEGF